MSEVLVSAAFVCAVLLADIALMIGKCRVGLHKWERWGDYKVDRITPHMWAAWNEAPKEYGRDIAVEFWQRRECLRCGRAQRRRVA